MEETALPVAEVGPVDFCALRRLASICRWVAIGIAPGKDGPGGLPHFEDKMRDLAIQR